MISTTPEPNATRAGAAALLLAAALLCAGCSSELASIDDTYVPASVEENYPIKVVERPVQMKLEAQASGLQPDDVKLLASFAHEANAHASTPVTVTYPSGNTPAQRMAGQATALLARQGVPRHYIVVTPSHAHGNEVTLTFARKVAETKPCGDWSENLRGNQFNEPRPNFGCAFQQNLAAMAANPEDLQRPHATTPPLSTSQGPALDKYYSGAWTVPTSTGESP